MLGDPGVDGGDVDSGVYEELREGTDELALDGDVSTCVALLASCNTCGRGRCALMNLMDFCLVVVYALLDATGSCDTR